MNQELQRQLTDIVSTLKQMTAEYAPQAWEIAMNLKRIQGAQTLLGGLIGLIVLIITVKLTVSSFKRYFGLNITLTPAQEERKKQLIGMGYGGRSRSEDAELRRLSVSEEFDLGDHPEAMLWLFALIPAGIATAYALDLFNLWAWISVTNPQLALAKDLLDKLTQH